MTLITCRKSICRISSVHASVALSRREADRDGERERQDERDGTERKEGGTY